jgi:hypothetical protein
VPGDTGRARRSHRRELLQLLPSEAASSKRPSGDESVASGLRVSKKFQESRNLMTTLMNWRESDGAQQE